jgi:hypothetical protein
MSRNILLTVCRKRQIWRGRERERENFGGVIGDTTVLEGGNPNKISGFEGS